MINDPRERMITFYMSSYRINRQQAEEMYIDSHCLTYESPFITEMMMTEYHDMKLTWFRTRQAMALIDMKLYYSAALLAFTFPEICGRVQYPELRLNPNISDDQQYFTKWFDENVTDYFGTVERDKGTDIKSSICLNGYLAYKIRCQLVHCRQQKLDDIPNNPKSAWMQKYKSVYFKLTAEEYTLRLTRIDINTVYFAVGIPHICRQIIRAAEATYKQYPDNPLFINDVEGEIKQ